jgi:hypothetical protein
MSSSLCEDAVDEEVADFHRFLANGEQATTLGRERLDEPVLKEEGIL